MPYTPICIAKAVKNSTESEGMRRAHVSRAAGPGNRMGGGVRRDLLHPHLCGPGPGTGSESLWTSVLLVFQSQWENGINYYVGHAGL